MYSVVEEITLWVPKSEAEQDAVRQQMNRMLETSHFKNSRRYPALFRFIIEEALAGRGEYLKERLIGINVFERPTDYDTAADPIVRVTIAEVRKRIAQYYHDESHELEIRIELKAGNYEPEFRPARFERVAHVETVAPPAYPAESPTIPVPPISAGLASPSGAVRHRVLFGILGLVCIVTLSVGGWFWLKPTAIDELWAPITVTHQTITFCIPEGAQSVPDISPDAPDVPEKIVPTSAPLPEKSGSRTFLAHEQLGENVVFSDVLAMTGISNMLAARHTEARYRLNVSTTLDDLRQGPNVLIGGLDNQWTLRALAPLRYRFGGSDETTWYIRDMRDPQKRQWELDSKKKMSAIKRDYAIVARIHDQSTGQIEFIVAGIGMSGTAAAGQLLTNAKLVAELRNRVGAGFGKRDFEAVLSTDVVNGLAGTPAIEAVYVP